MFESLLDQFVDQNFDNRFVAYWQKWFRDMLRERAHPDTLAARHDDDRWFLVTHGLSSCLLNHGL